MDNIDTTEDTDIDDVELAEMAADPDIQREIAEINDEFACTYMDGLRDL